MNRLVDTYGRAHTYLRISVTDRCNLRCAYCMPVEQMQWMRREDILTFEEIERIARVAAGMGIEKIRVTGGEPLVRRDVPQLLASLRSIGGIRSVALTTNAVLLARHIDAIRPHVDALNVSLDTFRADRFRELTRRDDLGAVLEGIEAALSAGYDPLKLNVVVMRGFNDDEILDFAAFAAERPVAVRFIEFMPFEGNGWNETTCMPMAEILARLDERYELERIPDGVSPISRDYRMRERSSGRAMRGTVGVIASMSHPFCDSCSRLRLTAEGRLMPCLHSSIDVDLRAALRAGASDADIEELFTQAVLRKPKAHPDAEEMVRDASRVMIQIGG